MRAFKRLLCCFAFAAFIAIPAEATTINLAGDGTWMPFAVDDQIPPLFGSSWIDTETLSPGFGSELDFTFLIAAGQIGTLTVVDAGFAGDTFLVTNGGAPLGPTTAVPARDLDDLLPPPFAGLDFDLAFANPAFSHGVFQLGPGTYHVGGSLVQSVTAAGIALNSTAGAIKLQIAAVPEPSFLTLTIAGLAVLAARRHLRHSDAQGGRS
jgi:hypothetical protein